MCILERAQAVPNGGGRRDEDICKGPTQNSLVETRVDNKVGDEKLRILDIPHSIEGKYKHSSDHSLNTTTYRRDLASRPGEVLRADAPELWRRRAAPHALRGRRLVPVREARAAVQAVARARVHVAKLPAEHRVVAHAARLAVRVLLAPNIVA